MSTNRFNFFVYAIQSNIQSYNTRCFLPIDLHKADDNLVRLSQQIVNLILYSYSYSCNDDCTLCSFFLTFDSGLFVCSNSTKISAFLSILTKLHLILNLLDIIYDILWKTRKYNNIYNKSGTILLKYKVCNQVFNSKFTIVVNLRCFFFSKVFFVKSLHYFNFFHLISFNLNMKSFNYIRNKLVRIFFFAFDCMVTENINITKHNLEICCLLIVDRLIMTTLHK